MIIRINDNILFSAYGKKISNILVDVTSDSTDSQEITLKTILASKKANKINVICNKHKVNLKTAALKFPYLNKNIATVLTGVSSKEEVLENLNSYLSEINEDLWNELEEKNLIQKGSINKL